MKEVEGIVEEIIYYNELNGYMVCELISANKPITAVGNMPFVNVGESLKVSGSWVNHPDYGKQFKVLAYTKVMPGTIDAIEKYLASGIIKGIGAATAKKIVDKFKEDSLKVLEYEFQKLSKIKGISLKKAIEIGEAYSRQKRLSTIIMFFQEFGISPGYAMKAYKAFGENVIDQVKDNPYILSDQIYGIGFKTADKIAQRMGTDKYSKQRIASGIKYVLTQASQNGQTFIPDIKLKEYAALLLDIGIEDINNALVTLQLDKIIKVEMSSEYNKVYLMPYYMAEMGVCDKIISLLNIEYKDIPYDFEKKFRQIFNNREIELADAQKHAIREIFKNGITVITGGPGTGKTTIIKIIIQIFGGEGKKVILTAPTGRAAKRMSEAANYEAKTIHRLLESDYKGDEDIHNFSKDELNPIEADVVVVDEMSMVDILLMNNLLKAILPGTRLILVGDVDQLPSVGAGNVLRDIIESGVIKTVKLTEIFRQAQESMIVINAHKINRGEYPLLNIKDKDFFFISEDFAEDIVSRIIELSSERLPKSYGYSPLRDIQVLTCTRKGIVGVNNLNLELQKKLNPSERNKQEKNVKDFILREGDRVMQIKNNYNIEWADGKGEGVFNGDTGLVINIDHDWQKVEVLFDDGKCINYDFNNMDELEHAFSLTVHKSQGSEFKAVIIPVFRGPKILLTRNLLYTAITRAKEMVVLVGVKNVLREMIDNNSEVLRYSGLQEKLKKIIAGVGF